MFGLAIISIPSQAATYYVRTDGGTNTQCTGLADAPYSGSGSNQACAWSNLMEALPPWMSNYPNKPHIKGGDTVIIDAGSYMIGWASGYKARWGDPCDSAYASGCTPQAIPSGTASQPTRILGAGWDKGCQKPPELWGTQAANQILDMDSASNVVIACLNLTDHSNCTYNYQPNSSYACNHNWVPYGTPSPNYGQWADKGIHAQDSTNVTLQDVNVHGFADMGVQAGRISNWTVTRVQVAGNGNVGWNGDLGGNNDQSTNSGKLLFTDLTIAWNGCQENWQSLGTYINCYGQNEGGYGDGFGEAWTGGNFVFIRPQVHHNTQDGLDLLYANGTGSIVITQGYFFANAGNDLKTSGNATITNNVIVAYCSWFQDAGYPAGGTSCRAGGGELSDVTGPNQTVTFAYNTMIGNPDGMYGGDPTNASASDVYNVANNIFIGTSSYPPKNGGAYSFFTWFGDPPDDPATVHYTANLVWHTRDTTCDNSGIICKDPKLANETLTHFDPTLLAGSPAIGAAKGSFGITTDYYGNARKNPTSIGALEYGSTGGGSHNVPPRATINPVHYVCNKNGKCFDWPDGLLKNAKNLPRSGAYSARPAYTPNGQPYHPRPAYLPPSGTDRL
ncbi:MAG: hypothetical protein JSS21_00135 [Proteobacteria bacterium]|nr:hypothetical protein [Pseudomonadota bacterium]